LEEGLARYVEALTGRNVSPLTLRAYAADVRQFCMWLRATNVAVSRPDQVQRQDLREYLAELARQGRSGVTRARKLAALRGYFAFLLGEGCVPTSPVHGIETPKKEKTGRTTLRLDEYTKLLSLAGGHPRDFCILTVFLQTGLRVSELCDLRTGDVDLIAHTLTVVAGKGQKARTIALEKKALQALKGYLNARPRVLEERLFLNYRGEPLGERGVRKLVAKYLAAAGITKKASPHSLRHTFATYKAEKGVSPFQLQEWLGHASLNTTQIYVHMARQNGKKVMEATSL